MPSLLMAMVVLYIKLGVNFSSETRRITEWKIDY